MVELAMSWVEMGGVAPGEGQAMETFGTALAHR